MTGIQSPSPRTEPVRAGHAAPRIWYPDGTTHHPLRRGLLRHSFDTHPLLQLDELRALAKRLEPAGQTKFLSQGAKADSAFDTLTAPQSGRSIDDIFDRIEEPGSWISMYNVSTDPAYGELLSSALESTREFLDPVDPGTFIVEGFIFVSAPPSVTPFHIDRENNFLIQIRGRKRFKVWAPDDRKTVPLEAVERFILYGDLSGVKYRDDVLPRAMDVELGAGEGIYMPSTSPHLISTEKHWVKPGDGVSITIGINFYTANTRRTANIHALNQLLRKAGTEPSAPGMSALDALKYPMAKAVVAVNKTVRGYKPQRGM